jgi:hypothetical protein
MPAFLSIKVIYPLVGKPSINFPFLLSQSRPPQPLLCSSVPFGLRSRWRKASGLSTTFLRNRRSFFSGAIRSLLLNVLITHNFRLPHYRCLGRSANFGFVVLFEQESIFVRKERVGVLWPRHLLTSFQCSPVHRFCLFILDLPLQHRPKVADACKHVGVVCSKHLRDAVASHVVVICKPQCRPWHCHLDQFSSGLLWIFPAQAAQ